MGTTFSQNTDQSIEDKIWDQIVGDSVDVWPGEEHPSFIFADSMPNLLQQQLFFMGIASDVPFYISTNGIGAAPQSHSFRMFATNSLFYINPGHCRFVQTSTMNWQLRFRYSAKQDCQLTISCYAKLSQDHKSVRVERAAQTSKPIYLQSGRNQLFSSSSIEFFSQPQHLPSLCHFGKEANQAVYDICIVVTPHTPSSSSRAAAEGNEANGSASPRRGFFGIDGNLAAFRRGGGNDSPVSPPPSSSSNGGGRSLYYTAITGTNHSSDPVPSSKDKETCISKQVFCFRVGSSSAARYGRYLDAITDDSFRQTSWNNSTHKAEAKSSGELAVVTAQEGVLGANSDNESKPGGKKRIGPRATAAALKVGNLNLDLVRHKVETSSGVFTLQPVFGQDGDEKSSHTRDELDAKQSDDERDTNSNIESVEDSKTDEHKSAHNGKEGSGQSIETVQLTNRGIAAPPPPAQLEEIIDFSTDNNNDNTCVICLTNPRDTVLFPCRHMYTCFECSQMLHANRNKCPVCRKVAKALVHLKS